MGICSSIDITGHCWLFRATGGQHVVQWSWTKLSRLHLVLAGWHTVNSTDKTNTDKRKRPPMSQLTLDLTLNSSHYYQFNTNECHSSTGKFQAWLMKLSTAMTPQVRAYELQAYFSDSSKCHCSAVIFVWESIIAKAWPTETCHHL